MIIIPAIDLKKGQAVRLAQGSMDKSTVYSSDPVGVARKWETLGARRLHIVDLDGAVAGIPSNTSVVHDIRKAVSMEIEIGGGIRDSNTVEQYLSAGIDYVIMGTAAVKNPVFLSECCSSFPGRIIVGIDARDGVVSVEGWTETTARSVTDFAAAFDPRSVAAIIYTDIMRDGMLCGPNVSATVSLAQSIDIPVIASGGISSIDDVNALIEMESQGISGVIIGRALYTGAVDLAECISLSESTPRSTR